MQDQNALGRLAGLLLAGIVVAIFAIGLAHGQDDWHAVLVLLGALLQVLAVVYATRSIWLRAVAAAPIRTPAGAREHFGRLRRNPAPVQAFFISQEDALVAGGMAIAGILLTLAGNLIA